MSAETVAFEIDPLPDVDLGDAPDASVDAAWRYPTVLADNGAGHGIVAGFCLGASVDDELAESLHASTIDHFMRMEFPLVVDCGAGAAHYFSGSKIYAGLYYKKLKKDMLSTEG